jgi:hypothetical protein
LEDWKIGKQTPILFLLITRILMLCIWVSFLKEDGLFIIILVIILSSIFVLKPYDLEENFGTKARRLQKGATERPSMY